MDPAGGATRIAPPVKRCCTLILLAAACSIGCATTPLHQRAWFAVETRHFSIWSSLDRNATLELARDLERFRSVALYLEGPGASPPTSRTQVYAFDGRGFTRPFDVRGADGVFLPSLRGGVLVLRTGRGWRGDATTELRHEYAHFLFRNREGLDRPLWFDEGFAQLASTIDVDDDGVRVGRVRSDHLRALRNNLWLRGDRIVELQDLEGLEPRERTVFQAQAWGLVHLLLLGGEDPASARQASQRYFELVAEQGLDERALERAFDANGVELTRRLADAVRLGEFPSAEIRADVAAQTGTLELRPLPLDEVLTHLGWLSITYGRPDQAAEYFDMAVAANPRNARSHAGRGAVEKLRGEWEGAREHYAAALAEGADDAVVQLEVGGYFHARASRAQDAAVREQLVRQAREHYRRSIALDGSIAEPYAVLGATYLLPGQRAAEGLAALDRAGELLPSSLEIELLRASAMARAGQPLAARRRASNVIARTHSQDLADAASTLVEEIDRR